MLAEIGADTIPQVLVFNKLDALDEARRPLQLEDSYELDGMPTPRVFVSARRGEGLPALRQLLARRASAAAQELPEMSGALCSDNPSSPS